VSNVTLKNVAERAGVDVSTASRALSTDRSSLVNPATRRRVVEAAEILGYRANLQASSLRRGRTGTVGVIVADLSNPFIGPVLRGIANALGSRNLLPIMTETRDSSDELDEVCNKLLAQRVDGLIITAGRNQDRSLLKRVAHEVPTVLAVRHLLGSGIAAITHDDVAGGRLAADHLLSLGHTRVAQLIGPSDISSFEGRATGFREAVTAAGATCVDIESSARLPTQEAGTLLCDELLQRGGQLPTAVFAHNDTIAIGALGAFRDRGITCPDDISIVGYNDVPLTDQINPPLTTIHLPGYDLGRLAAELMVNMIDGAEATTNAIVLAPELIVRASTARPRHTARG
jgi:LacI family transcriptional regulator